MINLRIALVALSLAAAAPVAAQDFTQMDITGMNNQWAGGQNDAMTTITNDMVSQNVTNPQVQAMYYQAQQQGYPGTIEQFAYLYMENGGFTQEGIQRNRQVTNDINNQTQKQNSDYLNSQGAYADAYGAYTQGFSNNMNEGGLGLESQGTYSNQFGSQVLPSTWGADTYQTYNGNDYYVDQSGNYNMAAPDGSGMWYGLN